MLSSGVAPHRLRSVEQVEPPASGEISLDRNCVDAVGLRVLGEGEVQRPRDWRPLDLRLIRKQAVLEPECLPRRNDDGASVVELLRAAWMYCPSDPSRMDRMHTASWHRGNDSDPSAGNIRRVTHLNQPPAELLAAEPTDISSVHGDPEQPTVQHRRYRIPKIVPCRIVAGPMRCGRPGVNESPRLSTNEAQIGLLGLCSRPSGLLAASGGSAYRIGVQVPESGTLDLGLGRPRSSRGLSIWRASRCSGA
ncbi:hypothetical protein GW17_00013511 [Ensete ventricosum]|nr:hypothetical protein GW17_00013511 [Ensete ventricosum]